FVRSHKGELAAEVVVISDSGMFARGVPSICYGLRGLVYFQLDLRGSGTDLHSGSFGGAVANPAMVLAQVLAQMKDRGGRIKIPGFYDAVVPLQEEERKATPKTVELKVTRMHGGKPWMTAYDNPYVQAAGRAIEKGFGQKPVFTREGGSIPVVSTFQEELGLPSVLFGVGLPDENAHAPNEKLDVANFHNGIIASAILYQEIAGIGQPA